MSKIYTLASDKLQKKAKEQMWHGFSEHLDTTIALAQVEQMMVFNDPLKQIVEKVVFIETR